MHAATKSNPVWAAAELAAGDTASVFDHEAALEACGRGERFALRALFDQESRALLTVASRILRDPDRAQEALCEGFALIWAGAASFRRDLGSGRAWMHALVRQVAMEAARRLPADGLAIHDELASPDAVRADGGVAPDVAGDGWPAVWPEAWPDTTLLAIYLNGMSLEQVAARQARPVAAVRSALRQALLPMRAHPAAAALSPDQQERVASAGEYVWGSLTPPEREGLARRMARDRALRAEVYAWQDRLLSLLPPPPASRVPPEAWPRIADRSGLVDRFDRATQPVRGWWRAGAMRVVVTLSALVCFGLGLTLVWAAVGTAPGEHAGGLGSVGGELAGRYMAVLNSPQEQATWVMVGTPGDHVRVTPLSTQTPVAAGQQLVLWAVSAPGAAPVRVGRVSPDRPTEWTADQLPGTWMGQAIELTVENLSGLGDGLLPHGPLVAQGTLERL